MLQGKIDTDICGNITRLDNRLESFSEGLDNCTNNLSNIEVQLETAKSEVTRPFGQEKEYAEKSKRLKELNILLNMDEKDYSVFELSSSEEEIEVKSKDYVYER